MIDREKGDIIERNGKSYSDPFLPYRRFHEKLMFVSGCASNAGGGWATIEGIRALQHWNRVDNLELFRAASETIIGGFMVSGGILILFIWGRLIDPERLK